VVSEIAIDREPSSSDRKDPASTRDRLNDDVADRLDEVAQLLASQGANRFRVGAYERAARVMRRLARPVSEVLEREGIDGLRRLPGIGPRIARAVHDLLTHGRLAMLERLRGESEPTKLLASVPGIGRVHADRLYHDLGIETLEDLEAAAHDRRLEAILGFGPKRLAGIRDSLAHRLQRVTPPASANHDAPSVAEILDVDREYRDKAAAGQLARIAPRRVNPGRVAWLPILHTNRRRRHYTALFSNTALAHRLNRTDDWVVIYWEDGRGERQCTVVTAERGPLKGRRVVRGREAEMERQVLAQPAVRGRKGGTWS
jgi:DNA polymerase (family 10)